MFRAAARRHCCCSGSRKRPRVNCDDHTRRFWGFSISPPLTSSSSSSPLSSTSAAATPSTTTSQSSTSSASSPPSSDAQSSSSVGGSRRVLSTRSSSTTSTNTISPDEISHFTRLSQHWWDPTGEFALLHRMNKARVEFVKQSAQRHQELPNGSGWLKGKQVLDVGCGGGIFAEALSRLGADTLAIDAAEQNIKVAQTHAAIDPSFVNPNTEVTSCSITSRLMKSAGTSTNDETQTTGLIKNLLEYRHCAAEDLVDEQRQFDYVCAMEPGGLVMLSTISRTPLAKFLTITMAESILRLVEPGTHTYHKYIKPQEMIQFFEQKGWTDLEQRGCIYDPIKAQWRLFGMGEWGGMTELANYFFVARKPFEEA
ncbi:Hexaprenyldihydroxybenzoate methyltransferase, mitochondrial [Microbotryomycetes sp. JL221]|nr:Hexaprenyldihydroxybenzoate methyltransferase, mitochondrial [Microbotryomycetes sp. JL221]